MNALSVKLKIPTGVDPAGKVLGKVPNLKSNFLMIPVFCCGAEGETRTRTAVKPPPPQDGVSTSSTTSAKALYLYLYGQTLSIKMTAFLNSILLLLLEPEPVLPESTDQPALPGLQVQLKVLELLGKWPLALSLLPKSVRPGQA